MFKRRPALIDDLVSDRNPPLVEIQKGEWAVAKPLSFYGIQGFFERLWHAWLVLTDRARAIEYAEDRIKNVK